MSIWWAVAVGALVAGLVVAALGARRGRVDAAAVEDDAGAMAALRADARALRHEAHDLQERLAERRGGIEPGPGAR